jgi:sulfite reductase (NADPH) flavoprotein alpha-component
LHTVVQFKIEQKETVNKKVDFPTQSQPVSDEILQQLREFQSKELYWLSGYCSGIADAKQSDLSPSLSNLVEQPTQLKVLVLFASQTGNAESIANQLQSKLTTQGISTSLSSCDGLKLNQLKQQDIILMVAATHGEGEPPDDAIELHELIRSKRAPKLDGVKHAVLALGDSSYEYFCQTGKDFEQSLCRLGSTALLERVDCDIDYNEQANAWIEQVAIKLNELAQNRENTANTQAQALNTDTSAKNYSKLQPFTATVLANQKITGKGSTKNIHHLEISIEGSNIVYEPGDSLGVWVKNNRMLVNELLELLEIEFNQKVNFAENQQLVGQTLLENLEITVLNKPLINQVIELIGQQELRDLVKLKALDNFAAYVQNHQLIDLLKLAEIKLTAQQLVDLLKPIKPRVYSIASSLAANPDEVHLTVALAQSSNENATRNGAASQYLIETIQPDDELLIYLEKNKHFKLPSDDSPIIMVGPGTGIAPFRAFIQEREERAAAGKSWLFFGNPHFNTDFLYQTEWQQKLASKALTKISLAFSRDQKQKYYVQHQLLNQAESIWQWIDQEHASLYVCGDMSKMAKDVEQTIIEIIQQQGAKSKQQALAYLQQMKQSKRYQRDVY